MSIPFALTHLAETSGSPGARDEAVATFTLRPIRPDDASRLLRFGQGLSRESRYQRFFSARALLPGEVRRLTVLDPEREAALVATIKLNGKTHIIGVARYAGDVTGMTCDIAVVIADAWHHHGLGRALLQGVLDVARSRGFAAATGLVLSTNYAMQRLALALGFNLKRDPADSTIMNLYRPLQTELH
jgi:acetyltransferase